MTKHHYLFPGKIAVSDTERPQRTLGEPDKWLNIRTKEWHSSLIFYPIASKEDEDRFNKMAGVDKFHNVSTVQKGIKINSENVDVKRGSINWKSQDEAEKTVNTFYAYFKESKLEETQDDYNNWNIVIDLIKTGQILLAKKQFKLNKK